MKRNGLTASVISHLDKTTHRLIRYRRMCYVHCGLDNEIMEPAPSREFSPAIMRSKGLSVCVALQKGRGRLRGANRANIESANSVWRLRHFVELLAR